MLNIDMKYYQYLDLDWKPASEKLKVFFQNRPDLINVNRGAWITAPRAVIKEVPELLSMFKPLGIDVAMIGFFITRYKTGSIHTDGHDTPIRINFPVLNCDDTETKYFQCSGPSRSQNQANGNGYTEFHPDFCQQVDSFKLTQAVALRVLEPHQVVSYTDNLPRISCTVSFKQDLEFLLQ